jgi:hypothetical protein
MATKIALLKEILGKEPNLGVIEIQAKFKELSGGLEVDPTYISKARGELGLIKRKRKKSHKRHSIQRAPAGSTMVLIREILTQNPAATNTEVKQYIEKARGIIINHPLSGTMVKRVRMELRGEVPVKSKKHPVSKPESEAVQTRRVYHRRGGNLYMTVWTHPVDKVSKEAKEILGSFIAQLNDTGRARFELVERLNPDILEVRETTTK